MVKLHLAHIDEQDAAIAEIEKVMARDSNHFNRLPSC